LVKKKLMVSTKHEKKYSNRRYMRTLGTSQSKNDLDRGGEFNDC